jgi:transcriptional regulator with XRE-family HTH domain
MTQERLAEIVGMPDVDGNTIAQLEGGRKKYLPEQPLLGALCRALSVPEVVMLRESGVITEPIPDPGTVRDPFPPGDVRSEIVNLLKSPRISDQTLLGISQMLEGMVSSD